ncbi:MAG: DUF354 domain-containing protein [Bacteroidales bacterium]|nr:DUF354 domain-containing protein [Bacteroidales bacterium]
MIKDKKLRILFFLIHPAKYHQFKVTVNTLIAKGHDVELIIIGRDILPELVKNEGWKHKIIFPHGRKYKGVNSLISAGLLFFPTIFKLFRLTLWKKYDLFLTDDLLSYVGKIRGIPTFFFTDDDFSAVPQALLYLPPASHIFSPDICFMGKFKKKVIGYYGYKSLCHLHPNHFKPDINRLDESLRDGKPFFIVRTVMANSKHDIEKNSIGDDLLRKLISILEKNGRVILNSERPLPEDLKKYELSIRKNDINHYMYFSKIFIGDSTTMAVEAAVIGTPSIEIDDWFDDFKQYHELCDKYKLLKGFRLEDEEGIFSLIDEYLKIDNLKEEFLKRRDRMLQDKIDVSAFLIWFIENYPQSLKDYKADPQIQNRFK